MRLPLLGWVCVIACTTQPSSVTTKEGTFSIPGGARTRGDRENLALFAMESGCEVHAGLDVHIEKVREKGGHFQFFVTGVYGCTDGWISADHLVPSTRLRTGP